MSLDRRRFLALAGATAASAAFAYPTGPIRLLVGFPAGGPNDILARPIAAWLSRRLGQPVVIENRPGSSGNVATAEVVRAPADGHTLLLVGPANAIGASLGSELGFVFLRDIAPVAAITREPLVMVVNPAVPATSVADVIAQARARSQRLRLASTGEGSAPHLTGELFRTMAGIDLNIVQFPGGAAALAATIEGKADVMFEPMSAALAPVKAGTLRALAVTTATHSPALPHVPTVSDTVPGFEASAVTGIGVPQRTPAEIIERLNREINAAYADPAVTAQLADTGGSVLALSPAQFGQLLAEETQKWGKMVRAARGGAR